MGATGSRGSSPPTAVSDEDVGPDPSAVVDVIAAGALAVNGAGLAIGLAALIFAGPAASEFPRAIPSFLLAAAVVAVMVGWRSVFRPGVGVVQDGPAVVMIPIAASIAATDGLGAPAVLVALALVGVVTALAMLGLSRVQVGGIVRYLPMSVVVAFVAGTGWYLARGGVEIIVGRSIGLGELAELFRVDTLQFLVPGLVLGVLVMVGGRDRRLPAAVPSLLLVSALVGFYALLPLVGSGLDEARADGWLLGPFPDTGLVRPVTPAEVGDVEWTALLPHLPGLLAVVAIGIVGLLLNLSGLEMLTQHRPDHRHELEVAAATAVVTAPLGTVVGFIALGDTQLARRMGVRRRAAPVAAGVAIGAFAFAGPGLVGSIPAFVVGATLLAVGFDLLVDWVIHLRDSTSDLDVGASVLVVAVMAGAGILEGLVVGVAVACVLFAARYSRVEHVRRISVGIHQSHVDRTPADEERLAGSAERTVVFELAGYLFFGSVIGVAERVETLLAEDDRVDVVVLDATAVSGVDGSGLARLARLVETMSATGVRLVTAAAGPELRAALDRASAAGGVTHHDTLDAAMEAIEEERLREEVIVAAGTSADDWPLSTELTASMHRRELAAGDIVVVEGEPSDELYVVESGTVVATGLGLDGGHHRLRVFGRGTLIGEIGFFGGLRRTATVQAETPSVVYALDRDAYESMRSERPDLVFELHDHVMDCQATRLRSLSDRLTRSLG